MQLSSRWLVACVTLLASPVVHATPQQDAYALFSESEARYRSGDFAGAAERLRHAYALYPEPTLLYNLGRALEGAGDPEGAIDAYTRYLAQAKKISDRGAIEAQVATLRRLVDEHTRLAAARAEVERARRQADEARMQASVEASARAHPPIVYTGPSRAAIVTPWVLTGLGLGAIIAGATLGGVALDRHDDAESASSQASAVSLQARAHDLAIGSNVAFAVGGVLTVAGVAWGVVELKRHRAARAAVLMQ